MEHVQFVVIQAQRLELRGHASHVGPLDVRRVGLAPLDAGCLTIRWRRSIRNHNVIGCSISRTPGSWGRGVSPSTSPLRAEVRVVVGLLLVMGLGDLVDVVRGHPGGDLHAGDTVT